jgi:hypothetical protein
MWGKNNGFGRKRFVISKSHPVHTFITPMGVAQGAHANILHCQLTAKHLFASIV